jgi:hypothetical protein
MSAIHAKRPDAFATHQFLVRNFDKPAAKVLPGDFYVTREIEVIVTVRGCLSCARNTSTSQQGI